MWLDTALQSILTFPKAIRLICSTLIRKVKGTDHIVLFCRYPSEREAAWQ